MTAEPSTGRRLKPRFTGTKDTFTPALKTTAFTVSSHPPASTHRLGHFRPVHISGGEKKTRTDSEGERRGVGSLLPSDHQWAASELSPQLLNPVGETAPHPGQVNYLQSHRAAVSSVGSNKTRAGPGFPVFTAGLSGRRPHVSFLHLAISWTEQRDAAASSFGAQESAFISHSRRICSSLKDGRELGLPPAHSRAVFTGTSSQ